MDDDAVFNMDEHMSKLMSRELDPGLSKRTDQFFRDRAALANQ